MKIHGWHETPIKPGYWILKWFDKKLKQTNNQNHREELEKDAKKQNWKRRLKQSLQTKLAI